MELGKSTCRVHAERGCLQFFFRCLELNIYFLFTLLITLLADQAPYTLFVLYQI